MIIGAAGLLVAAAALLVLDVANLFHQQRELQKAADAAALAAVEMLDDACAAPAATARAIARANGFPDDGTLGTECGHWAVDGRAQTPQNLSNYFEPGVTDFNAVRVRLERDMPYLMVFGGAASRRIDAEATATGRPLVTFSVGSGLLGLSDASIVNRLLGRKLGSSVTLDLASYQGLAAALAQTNLEFRRRFAHVERGLAARGRSVADATLADMDELWEEAKRTAPGAASGAD